MKKTFLFFGALILLFLLSTGCRNESRLLVGGFAKPGEKGLTLFDFNERNGDLKLISKTDAGADPAYFCYSGKKSLLYVLNGVMEFKGIFGGGLTTLNYDSQNGLTEKKNELLVPYGAPCYISMSPDSGFLFIANYTNGSVVVVKLDVNGIPETITDSLIYYRNAPRQSNVNMIQSDPSGQKIYVTDLGLDRILTYDFDSNTGKFNRTSADTLFLPTGSGPRHFIFSADGSKMYVINELDSKMMVLNIDKKEGLKLIQTLPTVRKGYQDFNYCAEVQIDKKGKFLYGSNRGENTIVTYRIESDGTLTIAGHTSCGGDWPRNFVIDPTGKYLIVGNQKSDQITVFKLDKNTGLPKQPARQFDVIAPAYLKFLN